MLFTILLVITGLIIVAGFALGFYSKQPPELGLADGKLRSCPASPNCASSENSDAEHAIMPLSFSGADEKAAWQTLSDAVKISGGVIQSRDNGYIHATFTSTLFRFVDDLEARLDAENGLIHLRSASRVGHSDLGANRKRVEKVRRAFSELISQRSALN